MHDNLLQTFRQKLNDPDLNLNPLYEFGCETPMTLSSQKEDFVLLDFNIKLELEDQMETDDVKKRFDSSETVLIKPVETSAFSNVKDKLFGQGVKFKKLSKEMQLRSLTLTYENVFLYDLENMITETFVTELNKNFSKNGFISFSGETKTDNKLALISPSNKLKFHLRRDAYKNKIGFELSKVHDQTSCNVARNN